MAKFMVKASEFKNVCKAVNDRKLAELKKEIIEILKKQDEKDFKKATDYLNSQEEHFTHLEKSLSGKWVEKAGYGVGTVRIWKGKKYKKIAPGKWARVFEKEGRGTNIAIGKLIAKVQKIDNVEDLMAFVMANKQRFVDENGVDLPVLDKLRAAVDARNGNVGSKETSKTAEKYDAKAYEEEKNNVLRHTNKDYDSVDAALKDMYAHKNWIDRKPSDETEHEKTVRESRLKAVDDIIEGLKNGDKKLLDKFVKDSKPAEKKEKPTEKKTVDYSKMSEDELEELTSKLHDKLREKNYDEVDEEMEQINAISKQQAINFYKTREKHTLQHVEDVEQKKKMIADSKAVTEKELARKEKQKAKETNIAKKNKLVDEVKELKHKISAFEQIAKELESEAEKHQNRSDAMKGNKNAYKGKAEEIANKKLLSKEEMLKKPISKIYQYANADVYGMENFKTIDEALEDSFETYKGSIELGELTEDVLAERVGKEWAKKQNHDIAREIIKDEKEGKLVVNDDGIFETKKETPKSKRSNVKVFADKTPVGTFSKVDENTVEMPTDKATRVLFDNLNKSRSTDIVREFMTDCYYDGENLVATDGKRLTIIKTGDVGFEPGYVNVKTDDGKITLERIEGKDKKYSFPNYKKVIPENNNQEVKLDNKALKDKLKQMKKEGAFNKKNPRVNLVFEDGKVMLDGTLIGTGDVKFKDGENYVSFNGDFLNDAVLSGDNMSMSFGENSEKAVVFGSDIGKTVVMPMVQTPVDYENNRAIKKQSSNEKAAKLSNNRKENERLVNDSFKDIDGQVEKVYTNLDKKINAFSDEDLKRSYDILNLNLDKIMDRSIGFITKIVDKKTNATFSTAYAYSKLLEKHPDVKDKFLAELDRRGISVKKSLFDDLFEIEVIEDEEVEEDPEENDSLFNDYSAEQPELFNSTELMVREAFNRCRVL